MIAGMQPPERPLRIALIAPYPAASLLPADCVKPKYRTEHPATWVRTLAGAMARRTDVSVRVISDSRAVTRRHDVTADSIAYTFLPKREPIRTDPLHGYRTGAARIRRALRDAPPDLVVGFGVETGCARLAIRQSCPSVVFIQGIVEETAAYRTIQPLRLRAFLRDERRVLRDADAFIAESDFAAGWARRHNPKARIAVIPHAMDTAFLANQPTYQHPLIVSVASLNLIKDPETVLRAFAALPRAEARLAMIGDGHLREHLEHLADALGVRERVTFAGQIDRARLLAYMKDARLLALGSRMDTSPNAVTEAHAAGIPVVATRTGGIPDMVEDGRDGFLVPIGDSAAMAERMTRLLDDPLLARRMGEAGREKVRVLNDPDRVAEQHIAFYREVIRAQSKRTRRMNESLPNFRIARAAAGLLPLSILHGRSYGAWRRFLRDVQFWPRERIDAWQLERFREMVRFAVAHTEGYRELYRKAGIEPDDIREIGDIARVPCVTKDLIRDNLDAFSARLRSARYASTGGSTGIPLGFYYDRRQRGVEWAFMHASWEWAGWRPDMRTAVLRGGFVGSEKRVSEYDPLWRELLLSSYYLTEANLSTYIEALRRHRIEVLQAYPSSLNLLCDLLSGAHAPPAPDLRLILLGSENVYDWQLEKFRAVFPRARLFAWYGQAEQVTLAPWCEHTTQYHARPFYGMTEILDAEGRNVPDGSAGEIVGTNFHNLATPFIRYRTQDIAVRAGVGCPMCKRPFLLMSKIEGRAHEFIVTGTGRLISMTAINMHDDIFDGILQFRFRQEQPGRVQFQYIPSAPLGNDALARIRAGLQTKLGGDVELELLAVREIPRSASGKLHFLDQKLPIRYHLAP